MVCTVQYSQPEGETQRIMKVQSISPRPRLLLAAKWTISAIIGMASFLAVLPAIAQTTYDLDFTQGGDLMTPEMVHHNSDNTFLLGWYGHNTSFGVIKPTVTKTDAAGAVVWTKQFGQDLHFISAAEVAGGYELIGYERANFTENAYNDSYVKVDIDLNGNILNSHYYDYTWGEAGRFATKAPDGGWIMGGTSHKNVGAAGAQPLHVVRIDANSNLLWQKEFQLSFGSIPCIIGNACMFGADGSAYIGGYLISSGTYPFLCRLDAAGNMLWARQSWGFDAFEHLDTTATGTMVAFGSDNLEGHLITFDSLGVASQGHRYSVPSYSCPATHSSYATADGGFRMHFGNTFMELDGNFEIEHHKTLDYSGVPIGWVGPNSAAATFSDAGGINADTLSLLLLDSLWRGQCTGGVGYVNSNMIGAGLSPLMVTDSIPAISGVPPTIGNTATTVGTTVNCTDCITSVDFATQHISCGQSGNGMTTASASNGVAPYTYSWIGHNNTTPSIDSLYAGWHAVSVTDNAGCTVVGNVEILTGTSFNLSSAGTVQPMCHYTSDGTVVLTPTAGTAPFSYVWDHDSTATDSIQTGLGSGTYCVTVTDAFQCTRNLCYVLNPASHATHSTTVTHPTCSGQAIGSIIVGSQGTGWPYSYNWSHDSTNNSSWAGALVAGPYCVTVTSGGGCVSTLCDTIVDSGSLPTSSYSKPTTCGNPTGNVGVTVSNWGVTGPLTYTWSHDPTLSIGYASNLPVGGYCVTVTDATGCTGLECNLITDVPNLPITAAGTNPSQCVANDGQINAYANTATWPVTWSWSHDPNLNTTPATGLTVGPYCVTMTDAAGCSATYCDTLVGTGSLNYTVQVNEPTCSGDSNGFVYAYVTGGTAPYTYDWAHDPNLATSTAYDLPAGSYCFTVSDASGCSFNDCAVVTDPQSVTMYMTGGSSNCSSTGAVSAHPSQGVSPYVYTWSHDPNLNVQTLANVPVGQYCVTVTDDLGCTIDMCTTIGSAGPLTLQAIGTDPDCNGALGAVQLVATTGTAPYTYTWSHDSNLNGGTATGLVDGSYCYTVSDNNGWCASGCEQLATPATIAISATVVPPLCNGGAGGSIDLSFTGGTSPYSVDWVHDPNETASTIIELATGTYCMNVTDSLGCSSDTCIAMPYQDTIGVTATEMHPSCIGSIDGSITIVPQGGSSPYAYILGLDTLPSATAYNLTDGQYTIGIIDDNGCVASGTALLSGLAPCDSVCPGDANKDGSVNHLDLLYVGLGQTNNGPARSPASIVWQYWPAGDWNTAFPGGLNHKHADCDGNGVVEQNDTLAIHTNYGQSHGVLSQPPPLPGVPGDPVLSLVPNADSLEIGDTLVIEIFLGNDTVPVDSVHGIAFTIHYDSVEVDSEDVRMAFVTSFLGAPGVSAITITGHHHTQRYIEAAITRYDLLNVSGSGKIAELWFDGIQDDLSGKDDVFFAANKPITADSVYAMTTSEAFSAVVPLATSFVLYNPENSSGVSPQAASLVSIFPNPGYGHWNIRWNGLEVQRVQLTDAFGKVLFAQLPQVQGRLNIEQTDLASGLYFLRFETDQGVLTKRLVMLAR